MKNMVRLEEFAFFIVSIYLFSLLSYPWWLFLVLILVPDLSMIGYIHSTKIGAIIYNFFHHRALSILIGAVGYYLGKEIFMLVGIIMFAHSSLDRVFDYGFKFFDDFKHSHLSD